MGTRDFARNDYPTFVRMIARHWEDKLQFFDNHHNIPWYARVVKDLHPLILIYHVVLAHLDCQGLDSVAQREVEGWLDCLDCFLQSDHSEDHLQNEQRTTDHSA